MTKFGDKTVLHVHVQVTSSFSQPLYYVMERKEDLENDDDDSRMAFLILCIFL